MHQCFNRNFTLTERIRTMYLFSLILESLDAKSLCRVSQCCWFFKMTADGDKYWKKLYFKDYTRPTLVPNFKRWKFLVDSKGEEQKNMRKSEEKREKKRKARFEESEESQDETNDYEEYVTENSDQEDFSFAQDQQEESGNINPFDLIPGGFMWKYLYQQAECYEYMFANFYFLDF